MTGDRFQVTGDRWQVGEVIISINMEMLMFNGMMKIGFIPTQRSSCWTLCRSWFLLLSAKATAHILNSSHSLTFSHIFSYYLTFSHIFSHSPTSSNILSHFIIFNNILWISFGLLNKNKFGIWKESHACGWKNGLLNGKVEKNGFSWQLLVVLWTAA